MNTMAGEIRVMTSGAFTAAYLELIPRLELLTKKKLVTAATSIGTGETSIPNRLRRGEAVDVVIVADAVLRGFIKDGLVMAKSHTPLARSAIGLAVRAGAHKPDIGTVEALKRALLQAKSVAYSNDPSSPESLSKNSTVRSNFEVVGVNGAGFQVSPGSRKEDSGMFCRMNIT